MKAYIAIKYHRDNRNKQFICDIDSMLNKLGIESCCITRDVEQWGFIELNAAELMQITFKNMDLCALVILDLTEKGVGLGIEAGYAHAKGKPIITIARQGSDISKTLMGISNKIIYYSSTDQLQQKLGDAVKEILSKPFTDSKSI